MRYKASVAKALSTFISEAEGNQQIIRNNCFMCAPYNIRYQGRNLVSCDFFDVGTHKYLYHVLCMYG